MTVVIHLLVLGLTMSVFATTTNAAAGDLDPSFSGDGVVLTDVGPGGQYANDVQVRADGSVIAVGGSNGGLALYGYTNTGEVDTSFSADGIEIPISLCMKAAAATALQPDGKIVVVGYCDVDPTASINYDFAVARFNSDGTIDNSFSSDGIVTTAIHADNDMADGVAIDNSGRIVVVGQSKSAGIEVDFAVARYDANGALDSTFSTDGMLTTPFGTGVNVAHDVLALPDGKIVVVGESETGSDWTYAIARYAGDGTLDATFAGGGTTTYSIASNDRPFATVLQPDGKIVAAGRSTEAGIPRFSAIRLNTDGSLDTSFSVDGKTTISFGAIDDRAYDLAIQVDGKILVAGYSRVTDDNFALARLLSDGTLDTSFSGDGRVTNHVASPYGPSDIMAIALRTDGRIVVAGRAYSGSFGDNQDVAVARYFADVPPAALVTPAVIGSPAIGSILECQAGTWSGGNVVSVQWTRDGESIVGQVGTEYLVQPSDVGAHIACTVFVEGPGGVSSSPSNDSIVVSVPVNAGLPVIAGNGVVGGVVSCSDGAWTGYPVPTVAKQWTSNGSLIVGAQGDSFTIRPIDAGDSIQCLVYGSNSEGTSVPAASAALSVPAVPDNTTLPRVLASAQPVIAGTHLVCDTGEWTGNPTISFGWLRDGISLSYSRNGDFSVAAADAGASISCRVAARNGGGVSIATSSGVDVVSDQCNNLYGIQWATPGGLVMTADSSCVGTQGSDVIYGTDGRDVLDGRGRNDVIHGRGGADTLVGGVGSDRLVGEAGADVLIGGRGRDIIVATDHARGDVVRCGAGVDTVRADRGDRVASDCEHVRRH